MDGLDLFLLRTIGLYAFHADRGSLDAARPVSLAHAAGPSVRTVKEHLRRLRRRGVFRGFALLPNARQLGLRSRWYLFQSTEEGATRVLAEVPYLDGVHDIVAFLGGSFFLQIFFESDAELARRLEIVSALAGGAEPVAKFDGEPPRIPRALTALDWRLVASIREGPHERHPVNALDAAAQNIGVSARTAKRHFARMAAEMSIDVEAAVRLHLAPDAFAVRLALDFEPGEATRAARDVARELAPCAYFVLVPSNANARGSFAIVSARRPGDVREIAQRTQSVDGVAAARAFIESAGESNFACLDDAIDRRVRETAFRAQDERASSALP